MSFLYFKMKNDFIKMEEEMDLLSQSMNNIVSFSGQITSTLHERRAKISRLHDVHSLLKKVGKSSEMISYSMVDCGRIMFICCAYSCKFYLIYQKSCRHAWLTVTTA